MNQTDSNKTFRIGGELEVNRLGFGAMRIVGPGIWGEPKDRVEVLRTLKRLPELGVNFVDTADSYGPDISEELLREALHEGGAKPYGNILIATKGGLTRTGPDVWIPVGRPEYLIQQAHKSRRKLGVETIDLWQLHRIDPKVPQDEQFSAIRQLIDQKVIRYAGLSEVSVKDIQAASKHFKVASVQNLYNLTNRQSEAVLQHCEKEKIAFIPWYPLAAGKLSQTRAALDDIASTHEASPSQIALAWLLKKSPVILPIPGTSKVAHLEENVASANIELSNDEFQKLDRVGKQEG